MFRKILVPLDGSSFSEKALPLAVDLARSAAANLRLVQVHTPAVPGPMVSQGNLAFQGLDFEMYARQHREASTAHLEDISERIEGEGVPVHATVLDGPVVTTLARDAEATGIDLIVMTTHGRTGATRLWLGSVADGLVRHTHVPLLLLHPSESATTVAATRDIRHILVPLDGSPVSERILEPVEALARAVGARVTLLHVAASHAAMGAGLVPVMPDDIVRIREEAEHYLESVAKQLRSGGLEVRTRLEEAERPAETITEAAAELNADVIAIATHGHGGVKRALLGSVADKVLRSSELPLLVLRPRPDA